MCRHNYVAKRVREREREPSERWRTSKGERGVREPRGKKAAHLIYRFRRSRTPPSALYVRGKLVFRNFYESPEKKL